TPPDQRSRGAGAEGGLLADWLPTQHLPGRLPAQPDLPGDSARVNPTHVGSTHGLVAERDVDAGPPVREDTLYEPGEAKEEPALLLPEPIVWGGGGRRGQGESFRRPVGVVRR